MCGEKNLDLVMQQAAHLLLMVGFVIVDHACPNVVLLDVIVTKLLVTESVAALFCRHDVVEARKVSERLRIILYHT